MHKVLPYDLYKLAPPSASEHKVTVVGGKNDTEIIARNITIQELYDDHAKPGQLLYLKSNVPKNIAGKIATLKAEDAPLQHKVYAFVQPYTIPGNRVNPQKGKGSDALRCIPMSLSSPAAYYKISLDRSYQFIEAGSPVEFKLRISGTSETKEKRMKPGDINEWIWLHEHFPHLRPDFILKSMPEGSRYMIEPVSNGKKVQFVIVKPNQKVLHSGDLTERLFKVKKSVEASIDRGGQGQLPKVVRSELLASGNKGYSARTGLPREQAESAFGIDDPGWSDVFENEDGKRQPPSPNRYMSAQKHIKPTFLSGHKNTGRTEKSRIDRLNKRGNIKRVVALERTSERRARGLEEETGKLPSKESEVIP
jgi:hypothetical protein